MEIEMKVKDAYLYHAIAISKIVARITDELYAAEFESEAPDLSEEERDTAKRRLESLRHQMAAYRFIESIGEKYEVDF